MANDITPQKPATVTIQLMPGTTFLTALFVVLKAFGKLDWSWWWVFAPMWGPWAALFGVFALLLAGVGVITAALFLWEVPYDYYKQWRYKRWKCKICGQRKDAQIHTSSYPNSDRHYFIWNGK